MLLKVVAERWFGTNERFWVIIIATYSAYLGWAFGKVIPCYYMAAYPIEVNTAGKLPTKLTFIGSISEALLPADDYHGTSYDSICILDSESPENPTNCWSGSNDLRCDLFNLFFSLSSLSKLRKNQRTCGKQLDS